MKKEARLQAEKIFLKAKGKITNKEIADSVGVNALTVGRWKRVHDWEDALKQAKPAPRREPGVIRKKAARDKALKLFIDAGGNITNKDLAMRVDVSPATISKWKELDRWDAKIVHVVEEEPAPVEVVEEEALEVEEAPRSEFDMGELASAEQIIRINQRIESLLQRDHLTTGEVAELASAKRDMLDSVEIYVAIARELGVIKM